jgi:hypothetical protein
MPHQLIRFSLSISYERYLKVYQGRVQTISVKAEDGRRIEFPAGKLQPFLTKQGINGCFEMQFSSENKFVSIQKL